MEIATIQVDIVHNKKHTLVLENSYLCLHVKTKSGVLSILITFQDNRKFSHINHNVSERAFPWV